MLIMFIESFLFQCATFQRNKRCKRIASRNSQSVVDFDRYKCMGIISTESYRREQPLYSPVYGTQPHLVDDKLMLEYKSGNHFSSKAAQHITMTLTPLVEPVRMHNDHCSFKNQGQKMQQTSFDSASISV